MIKYIYALFLGLLLSIFVGVGIATFYQAPDSPDYERLSQPVLKEGTTEQLAQQEQLNQEQAEYQSALSVYHRNVSIMTLVAATLILIVALTAATKLSVIADGLLLGGLFTLLYSLGLGLSTDDTSYRFIIITIGLAAALFIGYWKFLRADKAA